MRRAGFGVKYPGAMYPGDGPFPFSPYYINGPGSKGWAYWESRGVMGPNVSIALKQITDGTSKTMMLGEIRPVSTKETRAAGWGFGHAGGNLLAFFGWGGDDNGPNC